MTDKPNKETFAVRKGMHARFIQNTPTSGALISGREKTRHAMGVLVKVERGKP